MKRPYILIIVLVIITLSLAFVRTVVANRISTNGAVLGKLEDEISFYKTENLIYKEKIYTLSSLNTISSDAARLGFVESQSGIAVTGSLPIALR